MKKFIHLFIIAILSTGCLTRKIDKIEIKAEPLVLSIAPELTIIKDIQKTTVDEFMVILFQCPMQSEQWSELLKKTNRLSELRQNTLGIEDPHYFSRLEETSNLLIELYDRYSAFLMDWSAKENCKMSSDLNSRAMQCEPQYDILGENPMNGGLPEVISSLVSKPSHLQTRDKAPFIEFKMKSVDLRFGQFEFKVKLRLEKTNADGKKLYKGEVIIDDGFEIIKEGRKIQYCNQGYAELNVH